MKQHIEHKFGEKLRDVREKQGLTLKDLAGKLSVSESYISQIERNLVSPSLDTLLRLCEELGIDPEYLFKEYRKKRVVDLVRAEKRHTQNMPGVRYEQLSSPPDMEEAHSIEAFLLCIEPGSERGSRIYGHPGREWGLILQGSAVLELGDASYTLKKGDSISFKAEYPHALRNTGDEPLEAVWIITPPRRG
jgi:transcriptional regulator with XRE-family HTH domain